jgi:hypothetical protein
VQETITKLERGGYYDKITIKKSASGLLASALKKGDDWIYVETEEIKKEEERKEKEKIIREEQKSVNALVEELKREHDEEIIKKFGEEPLNL